MAFSPVTGQPVQYSTEDNELASGYYLKLYDANTTVPYSMAVDSTGVERLAKAKLNDEGYPISNPLDNDTVFIPHVDQDYRIVLYRNETDADNNTTANAAWNVDGVTQDVAQLASIVDITTKGTTLQAQDDYDRSPLFVDGTDFTAGAGPHVITVPAEWTPSNSDMRFYRLASNGVVTNLTPTVTTGTTFTLAETLLSTDTIFIGDDTFRNQMDGDPIDIKTRLGLYSDIVANHVRAGNTQIIDGSAGSGGSGLQIQSIVTEGSFETFGPTGSGATNIWSSMDVLPSDAKVILVDVFLFASGSGVGQTNVRFYATAGGESSVTDTDDNELATALFRPTTASEEIGTRTSVSIPLDSSQIFRATWRAIGDTNRSVQMYYRGFMSDS